MSGVCIDNEIKCCGGAELHGLDYTGDAVLGKDWCKQVLLEMYDEFGWDADVDEGLGWLVMSTVKPRRPLQSDRGTLRMRYLSDFVRRNNLGRMSIQRGTTYNPNSTNMLRTAMWHLDCKAIKRYVEKQGWRTQRHEGSWCF